MEADIKEELLSVEADLQDVQGKKAGMLEINIAPPGNNTRSHKIAKCSHKSTVETKLDELRKELSSSHSGIFPHAVLSMRQISMLGTQKPTSIEELEKIIGKVKAEKYGCRIIKLVQNYIMSEQPNVSMQPAAKATENGGNKRQKKNKAIVFVESSEDEE